VREVAGSNPVVPTIFLIDIRRRLVLSAKGRRAPQTPPCAAVFAFPLKFLAGPWFLLREFLAKFFQLPSFSGIVLTLRG
jgi:hypothetical protein